ncbi:hypothetical protein K7X08_018460 [Anisodus acutangulus]|uniref:Uncharacterized protein n=1 Tax=Anisodus acutangulus TaxID=402998 RepID=A0A9Q1LW43_9SOLA|nr:hypothetical protein K7X08_018460 [Anisodus acutangulus]
MILTMNCGTNFMIELVCPKPRRVNCNCNCNSEWVMKLPFSNQAEALDSNNGAEAFLDLILREDGTAAMPSASLLSSSPPFFNGSPPS